MSGELQITVLTDAGNEHVTVLHLKGSLDSNTHKELESKADELIAGGTKNFVVELTDIEYMGSAGLRALHGMLNGVKGSGGAVKLLKPSDQVARVFKTLGFDQFFEIFDSVEEALASF